MCIHFFRAFAILLGICLCSPAGNGQEKKEAIITPFQETADSLLASSALQMLEYWHLPHFMSWSRLKGSDSDAAFLKQCKRFPDDLMKALSNRESVDHESAVHFLALYASVSRNHAARLLEKDLSSTANLALAPHTVKIREALIASLQVNAPKTRLMAAIALLSLDERHSKANEVLQASATLADVELLSESSWIIGVAGLTSPQAIEFLSRLLKHRDPSVRESAASAAITMGPLARDLAPALIAFLETGDDARGKYIAPFTIQLTQSRNLALVALESMKQHAKPAVPAILARFVKANDEDKIAMLACLASIGHKDDACLALARKSLDNEKPNLKIAAACTILHLASGDRKATELLKSALADEATLNLALETCRRFGPPSREIVASLVLILDSKTEDVRINAAYALAQIGPLAVESVPGLDRMLAKDVDNKTHTFASSCAAAYALGKIGGKDAAAVLLRVADSKAPGTPYAMMFLPDLGDDLPPTTLAVLLRAIESDDGPKDVAAIALCNLGEHARPVRRYMERLLEVPEAGWILDTALRRIPANPR